MVNFKQKGVLLKMKKFYEKPVVEITRFAFEDIMEKSVVQVVAADQNAQAVINEIERQVGANVKAKKYSAYNW